MVLSCLNFINWCRVTGNRICIVKRIERFNIIEDIAYELQEQMTTSQINTFLGGFNFQYETKSAVSSKRVYVEECLATAPDQQIIEIASELDISIPARDKEVSMGMMVADTTISAIARIVTGDSGISPYRSGPQLVTFFNQFGWDDTYGNGFPSRWLYAEEKIGQANDTPKLRQIICQAVDPRHFLNSDFDIEIAVDDLNQYLLYDGYKLAKEKLAYKLVKICQQDRKGEPVKNLIFAANGPKPEIVLIDATTNDIEIVKNKEYCLVYNKGFSEDGLFLWETLVDWWSEANNLSKLSRSEQRKSLFRRLEQSLTEEPERILFRAYYNHFWKELDAKLPALIPQVYLHYDPYTLKQLQGIPRLARQRMDFLLLLHGRRRVVIEIDGKQHYAEGDRASPKRYAVMVAEDRRLKLGGYELFRFGGYEFQSPEEAKEKIIDFFQRLLNAYQEQ